MSLFSERLKICRNKKGLTQKEFATILEMKERSYQRYESGDREPTFDGLIALADFFGVSLDYLVGRSDNPDMDPPAPYHNSTERSEARSKTPKSQDLPPDTRCRLRKTGVNK